MKKNLFIILISTLFILILIYFYDKKDSILNKEYIDNQSNIYIEYPFFNNQTVDEFMNHYLNSYIDDYSFYNHSLFIDYDYEEDNDKINLAMYIYQNKENVVKNETSSFVIDIHNSKISSNINTLETNVDYDGFLQKVIDKNKPMVALTFDDGPNHNTTKVLNILEQYGIKATFFILGTNIEGNEKTIKRMSDLGMEIGNHMFSHKLLTKLSNETIQEEVKRVDDLIFNITDKYPTLIRPSYGTYNKRIKSLMNKPIIIWNVDTLDWKYHNSKRIASRVMKSISDGDIILMHDIYSATANSLNIIIPELVYKGYQFVTVSELLYYKGIEIKKGNVYSNAN